MRKQIALSAVAVGFAAAFLAAPAANAEPVLKNDLGMRPSSGLRPGQSAEVFGICNEPGFKSRKLESTVLEPTEVHLNEGDGEAPSLAGQAKVKKDAKPGRYTVSFRCEGVSVKTTVVIAPAKNQPVLPGQVKVKPKGAADTGGMDGTLATDLG